MAAYPDADAPDPHEPPADPWDSALLWAYAPDAAPAESSAPEPGRAPHPKAVDWTAGTTGRYTVRGEIARGGVGTILLAHDHDLGRDVAVKILHEHLGGDPALLQRFVEEARIGCQLQHPGLVPVYELGLDLRQRPYFTMKLVQGKTLAQILQTRPPTIEDLPRLLDVFGRVCETVAYAHARGVVHRDLKPGNIMVGEFGEVLVMDWGFAKVLARARDPVPAHDTPSIGGASASIAGSVLGTPAYMPPEQASGRTELLDAHADVFALGAILCEILTGTPPYVGDELLQQARAGLVGPALAKLARCGHDPELVRIATACLQPDPARRPASAQELRAELAAFAASTNARADAARFAAVTAQARMAEERKRRRLWLGLTATSLCLVIAAAALLLGKRDRLQHTTRAANEALSRAWQQLAADDPRGALVAVEEARTIVKAGTPDAATIAAVDAAAARIAPKTRDFLIEKKVMEALLPPGSELRPGNSELVDALRSIGLDVRKSHAEIESQFRALEGEASPILLRALHDLAARPQWMSKPPSFETQEVLAALDRLDATPVHCKVRRAWAACDAAELRALQYWFEQEDVPATAHELLGMAFMHCTSFGEAIGPYAMAHALDRQAFWVNHRLAQLYRTTDPPRTANADRHADLAAATFPGVRFGIALSQAGITRSGGRRGHGHGR